MADTKERLVKCFAAVFPALTADQILSASVDSVAKWDSLASITLVAVVQEEFRLQIDLLDLAELTSFSAVLSYIQSRSS